MNFTDISSLRLASQQIAGTNFRKAGEIVSWMGAMQAQDLNMAKWAVGIRLPGSTEETIEAAMNKSEIFRTHVMRPTWHFVSADDIYWMLELTAPQIKAILKGRDKDLGITENDYEKSHTQIEKVLKGGKDLSRDELVIELEDAGIATGNFRISHFLLRAEIDGLVCSGTTKGSQQTYALLRERVPKPKSITREDALARLAKKYFSSHCPATLQDFAWWSGLTITESKKALEMVKSDFVSDTICNETYWFFNSYSFVGTEKESAFMLPAYDEFIISYKDRKACLPYKNHTKAVSSNGVFRPVIVINGQVTGIWNRTVKKDKVVIETHFFSLTNKATKNMTEEAFLPYGNFLNKKVEIVFK